MTELMFMIAGPSIDDGLAVLDAIFAANLEVVANVVTLASLPIILPHALPDILVITGWNQESATPLQQILGGHDAADQAPPRVLLLHHIVPADLPPTWLAVTPGNAASVLRAWLGMPQ
jgi:hypothetical protein